MELEKGLPLITSHLSIADKTGESIYLTASILLELTKYFSLFASLIGTAGLTVLMIGTTQDALKA